MRYLIAPDSYKGSLSAACAAQIIGDTIRHLDPNAEIFLLPLADGGEGTVDVLLQGRYGTAHFSDVTGPAGKVVSAKWALLNSGNTAVIESASCVGLTLLAPEKRNPKYATSYGLGELILQAVSSGCSRILIGLGGSATNDCGFGMAQALGFEFESSGGKLPVDLAQNIPDQLFSVQRVNRSRNAEAVDSIEFIALSDVTNPLLGTHGATKTYGPQKGARIDDVPILENALGHFSEIIRRDVRDIDCMEEGMGAAGGLGYGLAAFCNARIVNGISFILEYLNFREYCSKADVIITGEGKVDTQTLRGKVISGISEYAKEARKPLAVFCGRIKGDREQIMTDLGLESLFVISPPDESEGEAIQNARRNLERSVRENFNSLKALFPSSE